MLPKLSVDWYHKAVTTATVEHHAQSHRNLTPLPAVIPLSLPVAGAHSGEGHNAATLLTVRPRQTPRLPLAPPEPHPMTCGHSPLPPSRWRSFGRGAQCSNVAHCSPTTSPSATPRSTSVASARERGGRASGRGEVIHRKQRQLPGEPERTLPPPSKSHGSWVPIG